MRLLKGRAVLSALLLLILVLAGFAAPGPNANTTRKAQSSDPTKITDAAGKVHNVMPMRSITQADRKAAARRARHMHRKVSSERQAALRTHKNNGGRK